MMSISTDLIHPVSNPPKREPKLCHLGLNQ